MQGRRNACALVMELHLSYTNPSKLNIFQCMSKIFFMEIWRYLWNLTQNIFHIYWKILLYTRVEISKVLTFNSLQELFITQIKVIWSHWETSNLKKETYVCLSYQYCECWWPGAFRPCAGTVMTRFAPHLWLGPALDWPFSSDFYLYGAKKVK